MEYEFQENGLKEQSDEQIQIQIKEIKKRLSEISKSQFSKQDQNEIHLNLVSFKDDSGGIFSLQQSNRLSNMSLKEELMQLQDSQSNCLFKQINDDNILIQQSQNFSNQKHNFKQNHYFNDQFNNNQQSSNSKTDNNKILERFEDEMKRQEKIQQAQRKIMKKGFLSETKSSAERNNSPSSNYISEQQRIENKQRLKQKYQELAKALREMINNTPAASKREINNTINESMNQRIHQCLQLQKLQTQQASKQFCNSQKVFKNENLKNSQFQHRIFIQRNANSTNKIVFQKTKLRSDQNKDEMQINKFHQDITDKNSSSLNSINNQNLRILNKEENNLIDLDLQNLVNNIPLNESDKKINITTSFTDQSVTQPRMSLTQFSQESSKQIRINEVKSSETQNQNYTQESSVPISIFDNRQFNLQIDQSNIFQEVQLFKNLKDDKEIQTSILQNIDNLQFQDFSCQTENQDKQEKFQSEISNIQFSNLLENYQFLRMIFIKFLKLDISNGINKIYDESQKLKILEKLKQKTSKQQFKLKQEQLLIKNNQLQIQITDYKNQIKILEDQISKLKTQNKNNLQKLEDDKIDLEIKLQNQKKIEEYLKMQIENQIKEEQQQNIQTVSTKQSQTQATTEEDKNNQNQFINGVETKLNECILDQLSSKDSYQHSQINDKQLNIDQEKRDQYDLKQRDQYNHLWQVLQSQSKLIEKDLINHKNQQNQLWQMLKTKTIFVEQQYQ